MAPDDDQRKAKDMMSGELDAATQADLERWFGLPSYSELAEKQIEVEDPEVARVRERRDNAIAAVDPAMLEAHRRRTDTPDDLLQFRPRIELRIDPDIGLLDRQMIERAGSIADPRELQIAEDLRDDMRDCTPQALLRDLHRPELDFDKQFEIVDVAADQKMDVVAEVATAMATSWKLKDGDMLGSPFGEGRALILAARADRKQNWVKLLAETPLPNRRWPPEEDR